MFKSYSKIFILALCFYLNISVFHTQNQDIEFTSKKQNQVRQDSIKIDRLLELSKYYTVQERNVDSIISIARKAALLSEKNNFHLQAGKAYQELGSGYLLHKSLDSAYFYLNKSYNLSRDLADVGLEFSNIFSLSSFYLESNDLTNAMAFGIKGVKLAEDNDRTSLKASAYYNMANTFAYHDDDQKQIEYLTKAYDIIENKNTEISASIKSGIYSSMVDYFERKRFRNPDNIVLKDSVLYYTEKGINYGKSVNNASLLAYLLGTKGKMYFIDDKIYDAKIYYNEALTYRDKIDQTSLFNLYNKMAYVYLKENNITRALLYKDSILQDISKEPNFYKQAERYHLAYYICKTANIHDLALQYYEIMTEHYDKAKEERQIKALNELEIKYQTEKKESKIIAQKLENETIKNTAKTNYFIISIIGLIGIGVFSFLYFKRKNKILASELNLAKTKAALHRSQLNPHFISNSINAIYPFLYDKTDPNKAAAYLSDLSQMIRDILNSTFDTNWTLEEELNFIKQYCHVQELKMDIPLHLKIKNDASLKTASIPALITQTFIENCFIHGFANLKKPAEISIHVSKKSDELIIKITDNGEAIVKQEDKKHKSRSNQMVEQRIINTYPKNKLSKDFLTYGIINNTYQVIIKLPIL